MAIDLMIYLLQTPISQAGFLNNYHQLVILNSLEIIGQMSLIMVRG
jgi:hypothetical protein